MHGDAALYARIYEQLKADIEAGKFEGGVRLPTEMELTKRFNVSRITAKRALNNLAEAGLVIRIPGRGTFLAGDDPLNRRKSIRKVLFIVPDLYNSCALEVLRGGMKHGSEIGVSVSGATSDAAAANMPYDGIIRFKMICPPTITVHRGVYTEPVAEIRVSTDHAVKLAVDKLREAGHTEILVLTVPAFGMADNAAKSGVRVHNFSSSLFDAVDPDELLEVVRRHPGITAIVTCSATVTHAAISTLGTDSAYAITSVTASGRKGSRGINSVRFPLFEAGALSIDVLVNGNNSEYTLPAPEYSENK